MNDSTVAFSDKLDELLPEPELVDIAAELTRVPSFTGAESELAECVRDLLGRYGIESFLQEVEPGRNQVIGRLGPSEDRSALLMNGHLDMDPLGLRYAGDPFTARRQGDKLYGAGLHNMKSGLAAIIGAAVAIQRSGPRLRRSLLLEFVVGELQGGLGSRHALALGFGADAAVVPEPYSVRRVITRTAGVYKFAIVVRGTSTHTSRSAKGVDAITVLRGVLDLLDDTELGLRACGFEELPRLQVASLLAGRGEHHDLSGVSYSADKATALIDIRYPPPFEPADVTRVLEEFIATARARYPGTEINIDHPPDPVFRVGGTDMPPMDVAPNSLLVQDIASILPQVSGFAVEETGLALPYSYCGNDTTHLARAGIECCLFGPRGQGVDTEEHVLVSEMLACARTLAVLAVRRCT